MTGDRDVLVELDRALDELAAGTSGQAPAGDVATGEAVALVALAAELRAAVPAPPPGAAAAGRAALLAVAAQPGAARGRSAVLGGAGAARRRRFGRVRLLAAALLLAVALPAALAGRALPGTPLWPFRQAGQQVRLGLTADPVQRAHLRLNTAAMLLDAARDSGGYRQTGLVACRAQIQAAKAQLGGRSGPQAAAELARAERLLADVDDLSRSAGGGERDDPARDGGDDRSGPGSGQGGSGGRGPGGGAGAGDSGRDGGSGGPEGSGDG